MSKVIVQVPMDAKLRDRATLQAKHDGFKSLQEVVRIFLVKLAAGKINFYFQLTSGKTLKD